MLQLCSVCEVADNTGAKRAAIIGVLGESKSYGRSATSSRPTSKRLRPMGQ
jgi:ribosomal protein L14